MVAPTPFFSDRGCHIRIYEEARALQRLGLRVRILTYSAGRDLPGLEIKRGGSWVKYYRLEAGPSFRKPFADISLWNLLSSEIKEYGPDLIHCHLHEGAFLGLICQRGSVPIIFDYQGSLSRELSEHQFFFRLSPIFYFSRALENWINSQVDRILLNCETLRKEIALELHSNVRVIGDGVDVERFVPARGLPELKRELGLEKEFPVVVYLGLLNRYQGVDLLLKACELLKEKGNQVYFLIMGYPLGKYPERVQRTGLSKWVKFTGQIDYFQADKFLALGDIAVAPKISGTEANGKILNYLAMGLPVVCFDRAVDRELASDCAEYAQFFPDDFEKSARSLADSVERLLKDSTRRRELSFKGRERAEKHFSWERVARRIVDCYKELV